jgi:hypothetical protein
MITSLTLQIGHVYSEEHVSYDFGNPRIEMEVDGQNNLVVTIGGESVKLSKKKVLETATSNDPRSLLCSWRCPITCRYVGHV